MFALSVRQPWASLIVAGARPHEVRRWHTALRGPLAIHASGRLPPEGFAPGRRLPLGAVLGTVELADCVRVEDLPAEERARADLRPGHWVWRFRNPCPFPRPSRARGRPGLFQVTLDLP
jgi:hypothetical protein